MYNLSKFGETLCELMFEHGNLSSKALAENLGVAIPTITRYRKAERAPTIENLVLIADYFHCSTDFLLGLEESNNSYAFKQRPPFTKQIEFLAKYFKGNYSEFYKAANIPESTFFEWKNGSSVPSLDSIIKISECFDCRVDFVLGRES